MDYKRISKEINQRAKVDQEARNRISANNYSPTDKDWDELEAIDKANSEYIKSLLRNHGFISISKFGKKASFNSWLIIQHAEHDIPLMRKYLKLMEENKGDYDKKNYAYLKDRLLVTDKKKQIYGTQMKQNKKTDKLEPYALKYPEKIDQLREEAGLNTFEEYLNSFN